MLDTTPVTATITALASSWSIGPATSVISATAPMVHTATNRCTTPPTTLYLREI